MPDTHHKSLQDIEEYFNDKRATLVSEKQVRSIQLMEVERSRQSQTRVNKQLTEAERKRQTQLQVKGQLKEAERRLQSQIRLDKRDDDQAERRNVKLNKPPDRKDM